MLVYADDAVIFAEDEKSMRLGLDVLMGWCREWSIEVNGEKCGVMHMRRKGVKRTEEKSCMGEEEIAVVEEYKYLGCVVDEHGQCRSMAKERAKAGARALSDWLRRCRASVEEVRGETFRRLLEMLVGSVLLYGVEVCMGMWKAARTGRECADESSEDIYGGGTAAPIGFPAV